MTFRVGIISDPHGLLRPEAERRLAGTNHIIHGGDIGSPDIIAALQQIAPVTAIRGNVDTAGWAATYADTALVRLAGRTFFILHDLKTLQVSPAALGIDMVVSGHRMCRGSRPLTVCSTLIRAALVTVVSSCRSRLRRLISRLMACNRSYTI